MAAMAMVLLVEDDEIVRLLRSGADDYVVKPFSGDQLDARIQAVDRDATGSTARLIRRPSAGRTALR
ncbi:hypothetical protein GCM10010182_64500 [Actinomadura cremea]|nr:hypothetical protein GCM10010182_64500 [Actinomadura cremea]